MSLQSPTAMMDSGTRFLNTGAKKSKYQCFELSLPFLGAQFLATQYKQLKNSGSNTDKISTGKGCHNIYIYIRNMYVYIYIYMSIYLYTYTHNLYSVNTRALAEAKLNGHDGCVSPPAVRLGLGSRAWPPAGFSRATDLPKASRPPWRHSLQLGTQATFEAESSLPNICFPKDRRLSRICVCLPATPST